jgi:hypothetical protein
MNYIQGSTACEINSKSQGTSAVVKGDLINEFPRHLQSRRLCNQQIPIRITDCILWGRLKRFEKQNRSA